MSLYGIGGAICLEVNRTLQTYNQVFRIGQPILSMCFNSDNSDSS